MKWSGVFAPVLLLSLPAAAETLVYSVNWPSGLSLGEATIRSTRSAESGTQAAADAGWEFEVSLDAAVPGFTIRDQYSSTADAQLCSVEMEKSVTRGARKTEERIKFDQQAGTVARETLGGGGKSEARAPDCARDAMAFLQFVRSELAQGRLAPHQPVVLGASYEIRLTYTGTESLRVGEERQDADKVRVDVKGPRAEVGMDLYFAHDAARTPLKAVLPLALGVFTVELIP
jgi:hypothetical protein